jgi:hypothetical protein
VLTPVTKYFPFLFAEIFSSVNLSVKHELPVVTNSVLIKTKQEPFLIEDLLYALVGIEGRYISIKRIRGKDGYVVFQIDTSMDLALQVSFNAVQLIAQFNLVFVMCYPASILLELCLLSFDLTTYAIVASENTNCCQSCWFTNYAVTIVLPD